MDPLEEDVSPVDEVTQALSRGFVPGKLWVAAQLDGTVLAETSRPLDFKDLGLLERTDVSFYHKYVRTSEEWVKETPPQ